jgi:hypothetical protein
MTLGHEARAAFLTVGNQLDFRHAGQTVQDRDMTFARHAEDVPHSLVTKTLSHCMTAYHSIASRPFEFVIIFLPAYNPCPSRLSMFWLSAHADIATRAAIAKDVAIMLIAADSGGYDV